LQHLEETGLVEVRDVLLGKPAQLLGVWRTFVQPRKQIVDCGKNGLRVTLLNGRH
jgi:hypothetical protein